VRLPALIRLLRPALVPTAVADVVAGYVWAGGGAFGQLLAAAAGSACLYMGGMVLNDLADRERDAYLAPDRPLVQHPGLASQAWGLVLLLFLGGLGLTLLGGVAIYGAAVAALAIAYDLGAKKKFPADALTLGAARGVNLAMGCALAGAAWDANLWTLALGYGAYIAGVTAASRTEDFKDDGRRRKTIALATVPMVLGLGALASLGRNAIYLLPGLGILVLLLHALRRGDRRGAKTFVLFSLLGIYLVHASLLWSTGHVLTAGLMLALLAASIYLLRALAPRDAASPTSPRPSA